MVHFASDLPLRTQRGEGRPQSRRDAVMFWGSEIAYAAREKERRQRWNGRRGSSNLRSDSVCSPLPSVFSAEAGRRDKSALHGRVLPLILLRDPRGRGTYAGPRPRAAPGDELSRGEPAGFAPFGDFGTARHPARPARLARALAGGAPSREAERSERGGGGRWGAEGFGNPLRVPIRIGEATSGRRCR